jgi:hypothetical protein
MTEALCNHAWARSFPIIRVHSRVLAVNSSALAGRGFPGLHSARFEDQNGEKSYSIYRETMAKRGGRGANRIDVSDFPTSLSNAFPQSCSSSSSKRLNRLLSLLWLACRATSSIRLEVSLRGSTIRASAYYSPPLSATSRLCFSVPLASAPSGPLNSMSRQLFFSQTLIRGVRAGQLLQTSLIRINRRRFLDHPRSNCLFAV